MSYNILIELDTDETTAAQVHCVISAMLQTMKLNFESIDSTSIEVLKKAAVDLDIVGRWEDSPLVVPAIRDLDTVPVS